MQYEAMDIFFSEVRQVAATQLQHCEKYPGQSVSTKLMRFYIYPFSKMYALRERSIVMTGVGAEEKMVG